jgi:hypothetical protein
MQKIDCQLPLSDERSFALFRLLPCASIVYM